MPPVPKAATRRADLSWLGLVTDGAAAVLMAAVTAAAARVAVSVPGVPVPFTTRPAAVLLSGLVRGPYLGLASQALYLAAGIAGMPVFALSPTLPDGALRLRGPTGGYLMAYPLAAFAVGAIAARGGRSRGFLIRLAATAAGVAVYFAAGVLWLASSIAPGAAQRLGLAAALSYGLYPFLALDPIKGVLVALLAPGLWWLSGHFPDPSDR